MLPNSCALITRSLHLNFKKNCIQIWRNCKVTLLTVFPYISPKHIQIEKLLEPVNLSWQICLGSNMSFQTEKQYKADPTVGSQHPSEEALSCAWVLETGKDCRYISDGFKKRLFQLLFASLQQKCCVIEDLAGELGRSGLCSVMSDRATRNFSQI